MPDLSFLSISNVRRLAKDRLLASCQLSPLHISVLVDVNLTFSLVVLASYFQSLSISVVKSVEASCFESIQLVHQLKTLNAMDEDLS